MARTNHYWAVNNKDHQLEPPQYPPTNRITANNHHHQSSSTSDINEYTAVGQQRSRYSREEEPMMSHPCRPQQTPSLYLHNHPHHPSLVHHSQQAPGWHADGRVLDYNSSHSDPRQRSGDPSSLYNNIPNHNNQARSQLSSRPQSRTHLSTTLQQPLGSSPSPFVYTQHDLSQPASPDEDVQDEDSPTGYLFLQISVRHGKINGVVVRGGMRILMDVPNRISYVQVISPQNMVYTTHYVNSMYFLAPTSAAGVNWGGIPWRKEDLNEQPEQQTSDPQMSNQPSRSNTQTNVQNQNEGRRNCQKVEQTRVEVVEVVFWDPYDAQKFKTVLDSMQTAFDDMERERKGEERRTTLPAPHNTCGQCIRDTEAFIESQGQGHGYVKWPEQRPPRQRRRRPSLEDLRRSSMRIDGEPAVDDGVDRTLGWAEDGEEDPYNPVLDMDMDPYAYRNSEDSGYNNSSGITYRPILDRIIFTAPGCLIRLDKNKKAWQDMYRGDLKVMQTGECKFGIQLEGKKKSVCAHIIVSVDMEFRNSCLTQFGFTFKAPASRQMCSAGPVTGQGDDTWLISFRERSHYDHFERVIEEVMRCMRCCFPRSKGPIGSSKCCELSGVCEQINSKKTGADWMSKSVQFDPDLMKYVRVVEGRNPSVSGSLS